MAQTTADRLVGILEQWGVTTVFGLPGDGINPILESLRKQKDKIRFIQVRHEESAAFMACAYAKYTGRLGVCLATAGPGGLHLLNGLYDAKMDGQPVLAITGMQYHDLINTHTQQDVELDKVFADVAVYNSRIMGPAHIDAAVNLACREALCKHGVSHLTIPVDVQSARADDNHSERNVPRHASRQFVQSLPAPSQTELDQAAKILNTGKRVAILCGRGALHAGDKLEEVADQLGAPIIKALLGKAAISDDSPFTTGGLGLLGTEPSEEVMTDCDTLLIVGSSFPYIEYLPKPGNANIVQIDSDPSRIGLRTPIKVGLIGDSRRTLDALLLRLERQSDRAFLKKAQDSKAKWEGLMHERSTRDETPVKPQTVAYELGKRLPNNAIISADSGTVTVWWARQIPAKRGQFHSVSGYLASMANGLPYAIAAAVAHPERPSVAFVGDGGFSMLMAELATCVKYELPVKVVVINNGSLGKIKWEQIAFLGNPEYGCELAPIDFAKFADACGVESLVIEKPTDCAPVFERALAVKRPVLVDARVDPLEPPMPARIKPKHAAHFVKSLAMGQPEGLEIAKTVAANRIREMV